MWLVQSTDHEDQKDAKDESIQKALEVATHAGDKCSHCSPKDNDGHNKHGPKVFLISS